MIGIRDAEESSHSIKGLRKCLEAFVCEPLHICQAFLLYDSNQIEKDAPIILSTWKGGKIFVFYLIQ